MDNEEIELVLMPLATVAAISGFCGGLAAVVVWVLIVMFAG